MASSSSANVVERGTADGAHGHKRHAQELEGRPSKRRRLEQASVLCMRELVRAMVQDGNVTDEDRIVLQNVAVLLSQIDGKTWVNFPDTDGELRDLTDKQSRKLKPFLDKVAQELRTNQTQLLSEEPGEEDSLELVKVPWADGITGRELMTCCEPDNALPEHLGLLQKITKALPTQFMLRSRVRELINYYYVEHGPAPRPKISNQKTLSFQERVQCAPIPGARFLAWCCLQLTKLLSCVSGIIVGAFRTVVLCLKLLLASLEAASVPLGKAVIMVASLIVNSASQLLPSNGGPIWPVIRLYGSFILLGQLKKFFELAILIARLRVILCLAECNYIMSWILYPFMFLAKKILHWDSSSRMLGCACGGTEHLGMLSWGPVKLSDGIVWVLTLLRFAPLPEAIMGPYLRAIGFIHPAIAFLLDLMFSVVIASGLTAAKNKAIGTAKPRLMWMSMNVSRIMRERPESVPVLPANASSSSLGSLASELTLPLSGNQADASAIPVENGEIPTASAADIGESASGETLWQEDGAWSLDFNS